MQLSLKEDSIQKLKKDLVIKNVNHQLSEIALQLAALIESHSQLGWAFISLFSKLLVSNMKDIKCWNDNMKSLFAITLDYGGPALVKIIIEKIDRPSPRTIYAAARSKVPIPTKLEQCMFSKAALFNESIEY